MSYRTRPICVYCKRFRPKAFGMTCDAFPAGILESILNSEQDHREPVDGDHGLQFVPLSPEDAVKAAQVIEQVQGVRQA